MQTLYDEVLLRLFRTKRWNGYTEIALFRKKAAIADLLGRDKQELATDSYKLKVTPLK